MSSNMKLGRGAAFLMVLSVMAGIGLLGAAVFGKQPYIVLLPMAAALALSILHFPVDEDTRAAEEDAVFGDWAFGLFACATLAFTGGLWWVIALGLFVVASALILLGGGLSDLMAFCALTVGFFAAALCAVRVMPGTPTWVVVAAWVMFAVHTGVAGIRIGSI